MAVDNGRRNVALLIAAQVLGQTASIALVAISALVAFALAGGAGMATLPIALGMVASAILMMPASLFMQRYGRRHGFVLGAALGALSGVCAVAALRRHSFALFLGASVLAGAYQAFSQFYRFAAVESVAEAQRPRAISWVVSGGIVAAFSGPALARLAARADMAAYELVFVLMALLAALAMLLLSQLQLPLLLHRPRNQPVRPLWELVTQPLFLTAVSASTAAFAIMSSIMSATPLAMQLCGLPLTSATSVIQWHMLGMFVPSLFVGDLIRRLGELRVMSLGAALLLVAIMVARQGQAAANFYVALCLVGAGWNFMFIGGSTLLVRAWRPGEEATVQASHDLTVFAVGSFGAFYAGRVLDNAGWNRVNVFMLPLLAVALLMMFLTARRGASH
jgi:predicted MFS family arabinose efflux permease